MAAGRRTDSLPADVGVDTPVSHRIRNGTASSAASDEKMMPAAAETGRRAPGARRRLAGAFAGFWSMGVVANALFVVVDASSVAKLIVVIVATGTGFVGGCVASGDAAPWPADDLRNGSLGTTMIAAIVCGFGVAVVVAMAGLSHTWAAGLSGVSTVVLIAFAFPPAMRRRPDRATDSR